MLLGTLLIVLGLTLFIQGLELGLFPIGEAMAYAFAKKGSVAWLLAFAFSLGFATTVAEPALIAVADEAARVVAAGGIIEAATATPATLSTTPFEMERIEAMPRATAINE